MDGDLVAGHVLLDEDTRTLNDARANDEERREEVLCVQVIEKLPARTQISNVFFHEPVWKRTGYKDRARHRN